MPATEQIVAPTTAGIVADVVPAIQVATSLRRAHQAIEAELDRVLRPAAVRISRLELMLVLLSEPADGMAIVDVAQRLDMHRTTVSALLGGLEGQGLIARDIDPRDARRTRVCLTQSGTDRIAYARRLLECADVTRMALDLAVLEAKLATVDRFSFWNDAPAPLGGQTPVRI